jgi:hypothetical protein
MKTKKAQQEIIVTVLLVLIAIAAVVLISNFVINMVRDKTAEGNNQLKCVGIDFEVSVARVGYPNTTITRGSGGSDVNVTDAKVLVNGVTKNSSVAGNWASFESKEVIFNPAYALVAGDKVEIAPVIQGGITCNIAGSKIVA